MTVHCRPTFNQLAVVLEHPSNCSPDLLLGDGNPLVHKVYAWLQREGAWLDTPCTRTAGWGRSVDAWLQGEGFRPPDLNSSNNKIVYDDSVLRERSCCHESADGLKESMRLMRYIRSSIVQTRVWVGVRFVGPTSGCIRERRSRWHIDDISGRHRLAHHVAGSRLASDHPDGGIGGLQHSGHSCVCGGELQKWWAELQH